LFVNNDTGSLGKSIEKGLIDSKIFEINKATYSQEETKKKIKAGEYEVGIVIPKNATSILNSSIRAFVLSKLSEVGLGDSTVLSSAEILNLTILFAPDTKKSFKASILGALKQAVSKVETRTLLNVFSKELNKDGIAKEEKAIDNFVNFSELETVETPKEAMLLNSVQHNVPAWTIFGMFFIVISMAGSIIKERDDGSYTRIRTMPGSYITVLAGKIFSYLFICIIQCVLMLLVGLYLLPLLGLPTLILGSSVFGIILIVITTGLAATGYGVLVGSVFNTHQQSSTFGAVSVVILAALGGIWVPVYVMPENVRMLSEISPLYWSLTAFHKLFLNDGTLTSILPFALKLLAFFIFTIIFAYIFNKAKRAY